jgi:uncharacterized metal-binding protein YceD (DUF177 family)
VVQASSQDLAELSELGCRGLITARANITPALTNTYIDLVVRGSRSVDCGRCLDLLEQPFQVHLKLLVEKQDEQGVLWDEDADASIDDYSVKIGPDVTEIPLEHAIAEQVLLNYNLHPLPPLDDRNRCVQCGRDSAQYAEPKTPDRVDPRWEKLQSLKKTPKPGQNPEGEKA